MSAKTGQNVEKMFKKGLERVFKDLEDGKYHKDIPNVKLERYRIKKLSPEEK